MLPQDRHDRARQGQLVQARLESCTKSVQLSISTETGSYFRLIDSCITQLRAQGPSRTCSESKEEAEEARPTRPRKTGLTGTPRKALRGGVSKVSLQQGCQLLTKIPHKMAPKTTLPLLSGVVGPLL